MFCPYHGFKTIKIYLPNAPNAITGVTVITDTGCIIAVVVPPHDIDVNVKDPENRHRVG